MITTKNCAVFLHGNEASQVEENDVCAEIDRDCGDDEKRLDFTTRNRFRIHREEENS